MKILHVIPGLNESSGPSQVIAALSRVQSQLGAKVTVCHVLGREADPDRELPPEVEFLGFPARCLRKWAFSPSLRHYLRANVGGVDIVHIHTMWLYPNLAASAAARAARVPYVIRPAGSLEAWSLRQSRLKKRCYLRVIERRILRNAARIHAVSQKEAEQIIAMNLGPPVVTIANGIDTNDYVVVPDRDEMIRDLGVPKAEKYLLFLGRLHPGKGLDLLLEAFCSLSCEELDARLVIAGPNDHDYGKAMRSLAASSSAAPRIHFVGELTGPDKISALQLADVFVLPSQSENFGVAILEALAAGTPAIVSQHTPWKAIEERRAGRWLPLDAASFAGAIDEILRATPAEAAEMSEAARRIAKEYSWEKIARSLSQAYVEIIEESKRAER